jgi:DNA replication protein DnaC
VKTSRQAIYEQQVNDARRELQGMVEAQDWKGLCPHDPIGCDGFVGVQAFLLPCPLSRAGCPHIAARREFALARYRENTSLPIDARHPTFDRLPAEFQEGVRRYCDTILTRVRAGDGLLLFGNVGVGKTCGLGLIALAGAIAYVERMVYIHMADLFGMFHRAEDTGYYFNANLLLLDDIGAEYSAPWPTAEFHRLVEYRHGKRLSTCATSNMTAKQMADSSTISRIFDRFQERCVLLQTSAKSQRKQMVIGDWGVGDE